MTLFCDSSMQRQGGYSFMWRCIGIGRRPLTVEAPGQKIIPMGTRKTPKATSASGKVGRPASKRLSALGRWVKEKGWSRQLLAEKLGLTRQSADRLCRGARRPGLDLALKIEALTQKAVPVSAWKDVPAHSED